MHPSTAADGSKWEPDEVIARNHWRLKKCYRNSLEVDSAAAGTILVTVRVGSGGVPETSSYCAAIRPASLTDCVLAAYKGMTFQDPAGGTASFVVSNVFRPDTGPLIGKAKP